MNPNREFTVQHAFRTDRRSPVRWVVSHVLRHKAIIAMFFFGAIGNAAMAAVPPVLIGTAFNALLASPPDFRRVGLAAMWIVISQLARGVIQLGRNFGAELIGQRLERDIRDELYASLLGKSMAFHSLRPVGEVMARATNDVREINLMLNPGVNLVVGSAAFLLMPVVFAVRYHPALVLAPLLYIAAYAAALWQYLAELRPITDSARQRFGQMNAGLAEAVDGIETVKGMARETQTVEGFEKDAAGYRAAFVHQGDVEARFLPLLIYGLMQGAAFLHALWLFRDGGLNVGQVVGYMGLIQMFNFPTFVSLFAYSQISLGMAGARRILELIQAETELDENRAGHDRPMAGAIEFDAVSFGYRDGPAALAGVSLKVAPGQTVAIVGQTGAGKTTLAKLINRTYDATGGVLRVDGVNVRDWNLETLRQQISIIEQDIFLFSRSIAENVAFGCPGATQAEIEEAARAAQAHDFITEFPDGYATRVGERGVTLSGGQRQRIALARALLTDPRILILDDATSAIDSATEDQIQRAIRRAAQGRTTLLITHRLSQIRWADVIVVLRRGRVAAIGDHDDLMRRSEAYRRIFSRYESLTPQSGAQAAPSPSPETEQPVSGEGSKAAAGG
ncbi:MAG: ABC transporter ATP-binding protein [Chloroflexi bacterium]|nr:ABC transporter ATP-binding protein [Chloroflexota bacterium]